LVQVFAVTTVVAGLASFTLVLALVEQVGARLAGRGCYLAQAACRSPR
jgi:hypothetical protein